MKTTLTFPDEVADWLVSGGFECRKVGSDFDFCSYMEIVGDSVSKMTLALISLDLWAKSPNFQDLESLFSKVHTLRIAKKRCVIIWEDQWLKSGEIIRSRLNAMLGVSQKIPARLTIARRIDAKTASSFLEQNHLHGNVTSKIRFGLFLPYRYFRVLNKDFGFDPDSKELLVAVATFSAPRVFQKEDKPFKSYELIRFGSLLHTNVVGGIDKLLRAFADDRRPDDIMTYADRDWSDGEGYLKLGFENRGFKPPIAFYLDKFSLIRSSKSALVKEETKSELKLFNMGSIKFVRGFKA